MGSLAQGGAPVQDPTGASCGEWRLGPWEQTDGRWRRRWTASAIWCDACGIPVNDEGELHRRIWGCLPVASGFARPEFSMRLGDVSLDRAKAVVDEWIAQRIAEYETAR